MHQRDYDKADTARRAKIGRLSKCGFGMERISWRDKVSNADVLMRVKEDRCMLNTVWQRKHKWLGHVLRHEVLLRSRSRVGFNVPPSTL